MVSSSKKELKFISHRLNFNRIKSILGISRSTFYRIKAGKYSDKYQLPVEALYLSLKENKIPTPKGKGKVLSQDKIKDIVLKDKKLFKEIEKIEKITPKKIKLKKWRDIKTIEGLKTYVEIIYIPHFKIPYNSNTILNIVKKYFKMPTDVGNFDFARILVKGKLAGKFVTLWQTTNIDGNDFNVFVLAKYKDILSYLTTSKHNENIDESEKCTIYNIELHFYKS